MGIPHVYRVELDGARWVAVSRPAGFASFVAAASEPAGYDGVPPADRELDMEALSVIAAEHDIELLRSPAPCREHLERAIRGPSARAVIS